MSSSEGAGTLTPATGGTGAAGPANGSTPATSEAPARTGIVLAVLILASLTYSLLQSMVSPALPTLANELHTSTDTVAWLMTGYLLSASVTTPIIGRLGDIAGKKQMLITAIGALGVGSLVCALSTSITPMIIGRIIQGMGSAVFPISFGIIRDEFPAERRAGGIGLVSAIMGIGGGVGLVLTGPIVQHLSYHWLFWFPMIVCVITVAAAWRFIPESRLKVRSSINWAGAALLSLGLVCLLLALSKGQSWGWGSPLTVVLFVAAVVLLLAWVWVENRAAEPLVDMQVMRLRGVWTTNASSLLAGFAMIAAMLMVPQFLQAPKSTGYGFGESVTMSGVYMLPLAFAMLIGGPAAGMMDRRTGSKPPMVLGSALITAGFVLLVCARSQSWEILLSVFVIGLGVGMAMAAMANLIVGAVPVEQTGVATGINTISRSIGMSFGTTLCTLAVTSETGAGGLPTDHGYMLAFLIAGVAGLVGLLMSFLIPAKSRPSVKVAGS